MNTEGSATTRHASVWNALAPLALAAGALVAPSAHAAPCDPEATVDGDAGLVQALVGAIEARREDTDPCPGIDVTIRRRLDGSLRLILRDERGHHAERRVVSVETAAALVEAWSQQAVDWAGMTAWMSRVSSHPAEAYEEQEPVELEPEFEPVQFEPVLSAPRSAVASPRLQGSVSMQTGGADTAGTWMGVAADGCLRLGLACIGGQGHYLTAPDLAGRDVSLLATVGPELTRGAWFFRPEAGVGWGWNEQTVVGEDFVPWDVAQSELRIGARLSGGRRLSDRFAVELAAGAVAPAWRVGGTRTPLLPWGDPGAPGDPPPAPPPDDPTDPNNPPEPDPNVPPAPAMAPPWDLPAFPSTLMVHVSVGIRFGGR